MITLRELTGEDAVTFRQVRLRGLQESPTAFGASYEQEEKLPLEEYARRLEGSADKWVLGAFHAEELVGALGFLRNMGNKAHHKGFIWGVYVVPHFRGQGIGRMLLAEALARLEALPGLRRVYLTVVTSNTAAFQLYQSAGFVCYGEEEEALCVDGTFYSEYLMVKPISVNTG